MKTIARIKRSLAGCRPKLSLGLDLFEDGYCLDLFGFLIALPILDRFHREPYEMMERWSIYCFERRVWFCWGRHRKAVRMPWDYEHIKNEVLRPDGSWIHCVGFYDEKKPDGRWIETYTYRYVRKSGEVQERQATVYVERREWRQLWLKWSPFFAKRRTSIEVKFSDEVGESTGSWKGGCIGCGWDLKQGETPEQALRRMEKERKFR